MAKEAYYFSHDSNAQDDPKCMLLIDQLGMEGYGIFWALIEKLRNETNYTLPLNITGSYAKRWGTSKEKVDTVIKKYDLFSIEDDKFFSLRLKRSMEIKSTKARESALKRWENANALQTHSEGNANGMRKDAIKRKENKRKESKIIVPELPEFLEHGKELCLKANLNYESLKFSIEQKYNSWVSNGWQDGHNKKIKNWKSKLGNTLPHLKEIYKPIPKQQGIPKNHY